MASYTPLDLGQVHFGPPVAGQHAGRQALYPRDDDSMSILLLKTRRLGQLVLNGLSVAAAVGGLSAPSEVSPTLSDNLNGPKDCNPAKSGSEAFLSAEELAKQSLAPIAWHQYEQFKQGLALPELIWTEPGLTDNGFAASDVAEYTTNRTEAEVKAKVKALELLYPPSSRPGREPVRPVHVLVFERRLKAFVPLLDAVAKVQALRPTSASSERLNLEMIECEDLFRAMSKRIEQIKTANRAAEWQMETLTALARGRAQALIRNTDKTESSEGPVIPSAVVQLMTHLVKGEDNLCPLPGHLEAGTRHANGTQMALNPPLYLSGELDGSDVGERSDIIQHVQRARPAQGDWMLPSGHEAELPNAITVIGQDKWLDNVSNVPSDSIGLEKTLALPQIKTSPSHGEGGFVLPSSPLPRATPPALPLLTPSARTPGAAKRRKRSGNAIEEALATTATPRRRKRDNNMDDP